MTGLISSTEISAQVITDGSVGPQVSLDSLDLVVAESIGTRTGDNLFHSFETFNIDFGGSATFTGSADIRNVVSRVTGGDISNIQGTLRSEVGNANFYFINPAGITFGEGGSVDVPASFHLSTAEQLVFSDATVLDAASPTTSTLSMATPQAFGFLGNGSGAIVVTDTELEITDGDLSVAGYELLINDAALFSSGDVEIEIQGQATIENGGRIFTETTNELDAGDIALTANQLLVDRQISEFPTGLISFADAGSTGKAGSVEVTIAELATIQNGGKISSNSFSVGNAGNIRLNANQLLIDRKDSKFITGLFSETESGSTGNAGTVDVAIAELATIQNGGIIATSTFSDGDAGAILLTANQLLIDRQDSEFVTGLVSENWPPYNMEVQFAAVPFLSAMPAMFNSMQISCS